MSPVSSPETACDSAERRRPERELAAMTPPRDFDALKLRLIEVQPELPKRLQQVAAFALEHPDEMALGTAASVAGHAQVQASTLVRFAQAIGFAGFSDLQEIFRSRMRRPLLWRACAKAEPGRVSARRSISEMAPAPSFGLGSGGPFPSAIISP